MDQVTEGRAATRQDGVSDSRIVALARDDAHCAKCGGELVGSAKYRRLTGEADARDELQRRADEIYAADRAEEFNRGERS